MTGQDAAYNWYEDAMACYGLWAAVKREQAIREGGIAPETPQEARWAAEGPRPVQDLEAGR